MIVAFTLKQFFYLKRFADEALAVKQKIDGEIYANSRKLIDNYQISKAQIITAIDEVIDDVVIKITGNYKFCHIYKIAQYWFCWAC